MRLTPIQEVRDLWKRGGFKLTKFISNKKDILFQIPDALRRDGAKDKDLTGSLKTERALGVFWDAENDVIKFKIDLKDQPMTRQGMLSVISSTYDPLGLACPFLLQGSLKDFEKICVRRCIKPEGFGIIKEASLHHFSDVLEEKYGGQSTY